jgi:hypothetical protein
MKFLMKRLTYANLVSTLALAAALGMGGAYAASHLGRNSVGPKQLRKGSVNSRALKNGGVASRDLSASVRRGLVRAETAQVASDGSLRGGTAASANGAAGVYTVTFKRRVGACTYSATHVLSGAGEPMGGTATVTGSAGKAITVETYDAAGGPAPLGFHLVAIC